jgi:heat shock protein HslJ
MKTLIPFLALILILGFTNCRNNSRSNSISPVFTTNWSFIGYKYTKHPFLIPNPVRYDKMNILFLKQGKFQSQSPCNIIYGNFVISDSNLIKLNSISTTNIFCNDSLDINWEETYLSALKHSRKIKINYDTLILSTDLQKDIIFLDSSRMSNIVIGR